ncbi:hypothetical protein [uncultured Microbacterium sp.]|uniref:hypothetical protein n=1 Tax=uncultured Microbacterium sp. TaxID=191216 RepID=UPI0028DCF916|nr:hypothetical protein [uncultured Microbacterium sp.]
MSGGVDVDYGGAIAVDTEVLRDLGRRMLSAAASMRDAEGGAVAAHLELTLSTPGREWVGYSALAADAIALRTLGGDIEADAAGVLLMADAYEVVELHAQARALEASDAAAASDLRTRADALAASDPQIQPLVDRLRAEWVTGRFEGLDRQVDLSAGGWGSVFGSIGGSAAVIGAGVIAYGTRLSGRADSVVVTPVRTTTPAGAPTSLPDALRRFPSATGAQVKVETYAMSDGTRRHVAYITGTQSLAVGGSNPWDMKSNVELYSGRRSASYQSTLDALKLAGAKPGERVDVVGYSQGGGIASYLAMDGTYDVGVQITAGSPLEPTLDDSQTLVQLRHTDDVVSSLAAGGSPGGTGSADSVTVERVADPTPGLHDLLLEPHRIENYIETAEMFEASGDRRAHGLDPLWADLAEAESVTSVEYHAERIMPEQTQAPGLPPDSGDPRGRGRDVY